MEVVVVGKGPGFVAVGHAMEIVAVGYACESPGLAHLARVADLLPWVLHVQPMYLKSLPR
jgi:hypothetical protein